MKRIITVLTFALVALFFAVPAHAIQVSTITSGTISAGGTYTSTAYDLNLASGYTSLQIAVTGSGTVKAEYLMSNDGTTYVEPSNATDIITGMTATGGPTSNGKYFVQFNPEFGRFIKVRFVETGGASSAVVAAKFGIR